MFANPSITPRQRELLILRVNWRTAGVYEWIFHSKTAMQYGITEEQLEAVSRGPSDGAWSSVESALLSAADQMLDWYYIDDVTWSRLTEHFDDRQLIEIAFVIGTYAFLAMALNSLGLQLDPDLASTIGQAVPTRVTLSRPQQIAPVDISPRFKLPTVDKLDDEQWAVLREGLGESADTYLSVGPDAPRLPNVLRLLMMHPGLTGNWLVYTDVLLRASTVDPRLRELVILRVCWRTRALYEWLQQYSWQDKWVSSPTRWPRSLEAPIPTCGPPSKAFFSLPRTRCSINTASTMPRGRCWPNTSTISR